MDQNNSAVLARRNRRVMIVALAFVAVMTALSFAAVPLYRVFCAATGLEGTTGRAASAPAQIPAHTRTVTVRFDARVDDHLPWDFAPEQTTMPVKIGQTGLVSYTARNRSARATTGMAVHNVTPLKAGKYFIKTQCFCFNEQKLAPRQAAHMPVVFYLDPNMLTDPNMNDVQEITLSYTFYPAGSKAFEKAAKNLPAE